MNVNSGWLAGVARLAMPPKLTKTQVKTSASLLFNNLAANGKHVAFVHGSDVVIVGDAAIAFGDASRSLAKVSDKDSVVHQVRWVEFGADEFLCIASQRGLQLYTADGKRVLHSHPPPPGTADEPAFFRGIAGVAAADANYICAGTSTGELHLIPQAGATFGQPIVLSEGLVGAITDACGGSVPGEGLVAAADASCKITAYLVSAGGEIGLVCQFENPGSLCTSVRMRRHWLLAAHATGHVRIYDLRDRALACVIGAHARWINALELHPTKDLFATASEDAHVSVWKIPDEQARPLKHVATLPLPDHVLTGVAFCGGGGRELVAATAYDVDYISAWALDA